MGDAQIVQLAMMSALVVACVFGALAAVVWYAKTRDAQLQEVLKAERALLRQEQREREKVTGMLYSHVNVAGWLQYRAAAPRDPEEFLRPPQEMEGKNGYAHGAEFATAAVQALESMRDNYERERTKHRFNAPPYEDG